MKPKKRLKNEYWIIIILLNFIFLMCIYGVIKFTYTGSIYLYGKFLVTESTGMMIIVLTIYAIIVIFIWKMRK